MPNQEVTVSDEISKFALHHTLKYKWEIGSNFNIANWILKSTRDNSHPCNSTCFSLPLRVGVTEHFPFNLKFRKFRLIHQMERTFRFQGPTSFDRSGHFGRSDRNAPFVVPSSGGSRGGPPWFLDQTEARRAPKFFFETRPPLPLISGSAWTPHPVPPYLKVCIHPPLPSTALLYPAYKKKQTLGLRNRNVPFHWARKISEISNRNFCWMESAPWGPNKASQPAVSLSKMLFGAKKTARLSLVEPREMIGWRLRTTFGAWIKTSLSSVSRKFKKKLNRMKSYQIYDKIEAMQQTGEDHREKYDRSEIPSSFMSPETPGNQHFGRTTPSIEAFPSYASCFLTPPCSQEKALRPTSLQAIDLQGLPKLDLELEDGDPEKSVRKGLHRSPLLPEDRIIGRLIGEEKIDFISDLRSINCQKICQKICSYLDPQDLCRYVDGVLYAGAYTDFAVVCVRSTIKRECII